MNFFSLEKKTILITGASSGIGRQCAISCSKMGAKTILIARNEERLKETKSQLECEGHLLYSLDITEFGKIESIIKDAVNRIGQIDGFIHSAGMEKTLPLRMMKPEYYQGIFNINVFAGFEIAKIISKKQYKKDRTSFVFISSIMSVVANSALVGYCASKGAINSGVRELALELAPKKIRVNSISPGYIQTEMMKKAEKNMTDKQIEDLKKSYLLGLGKPEDVSNACIYLLSDASSWVTGINLIVDGGYTTR